MTKHYRQMLLALLERDDLPPPTRYYLRATVEVDPDEAGLRCQLLWLAQVSEKTNAEVSVAFRYLADTLNPEESDEDC